MAVDANSVTLVDYTAITNPPLVRKISHSLIMNGNFLQDVPLITYKSMNARGKRFTGAGLPGANWRSLNSDPVVTKGVPEDYSEQAYILSNSIDVDNVLLEDVNQIQNPFAVQLSAYLKGATYEMNDRWINNNHLTGNPNAPIGVRSRLDNPVDWGIEAECKINGGGVDMTAAMTEATANTFFELFQQMLDYMGATEGDGCVVYVNDTLKRRIDRAARVLKGGAGFNTVQDAFDRSVLRFKNAVIRDIGRKADQSTRIITNTETAGGADGSSTFTSMYAARFNQEDGMLGWQFKSLQEAVVGPKGLDNNTQQRLTIDYVLGLLQQGTRDLARVYNIKIS